MFMLDLLPWLPLLLQGLLRTILLFAITAVLGSALGLFIGLGRLARQRTWRRISGLYVEIFRGVPLYINLFWLYFVFPSFGLSLSLWQAAIFGCTLTHAAYFAEYVRAAVLAVPSGQHDAARSLGLSRWQRFRHVILPQAVVALLPVIGSELVMLLKGTAIASLIGFSELTGEAHSVIVSTYQSVPVLLVVLCVYYVAAKAVVVSIALLERHNDPWTLRRERLLA
ncbi:amino acid ABC transporter permease [Rhizobium lusitanum]